MTWKIRSKVVAERFRRRYRFEPPPWWADLTGYEPLLEVIDSHRLYVLHGDVLEIGVFLGGGTRKLCGAFARRAPSKRVIAVDIFDPEFDNTACTEGVPMAKLYADRLQAVAASDQRTVFDEVTRGCPNLTVIEGDSTKVHIPTDVLCFAFIDGHHDSEYVRSDFDLAWSRLSAGGVVALHDYGHDLPQVTHTINALVGEHAVEISKMWVVGTIAFIRKAPEGS